MRRPVTVTALVLLTATAAAAKERAVFLSGRYATMEQCEKQR